MKHFALTILWLMTAAATSMAWARAEYDVEYIVAFAPKQGAADVRIVLDQRAQARVTRLSFLMPPERYSDIDGDGEVQREEDRVVWTPPEAGGALRYRYRIDRQRRGGGYDARITEDWAIVRGDDLVPPATVRTTKGADSSARLRFELPSGWSNVDTGWSRTRDGQAFVVVNPERRFDRPTGWIIAGDVGTRREVIEGMEVSVAAPKGQAYPRLEILGYVNAMAAEFRHAFGTLPRKILIVGAGDPMWRGGLSGPRSLWLHADRPLISENGTSTLVHELVHVITRLSAEDEDDWIVEGLAEYYSIEFLHRAGLTSPERRARSLQWMARHGRNVKTLKAARSSGPRTARAVTLFAALDEEIREATNDEENLDEVVRELVQRRKVSFDDLRELAADALGRESRVLADAPLD